MTEPTVPRAPDWLYRPPRRSESDPRQCNYVRADSAKLFRWSGYAKADVTIDRSGTYMSVSLDRTELLALRDSLNDALTDIDAELAATEVAHA